jgi:tetratricopeptide (TPR) repeat protein
MTRRRILALGGLGMVLALALGQPGTAAADTLSHNEELLYQLYAGQLHWLTVLMGVVGGAFTLLGVFFVGFQVWMQIRDAQRQRSLQQQTEDAIKRTNEQARVTAEHTNTIMERMAELINAMCNMTDLANQSQRNVASLAETIRNWELRKEQSLTDLHRQLITFALKYNRFNVPARELDYAFQAISSVRTTWRVEEEELPIEALLVQGLHDTLKYGDNARAIREFTKVIDSPRAGKELKEQALLNRGINRANLQQYADASKDFEAATRENPQNLLYQFYRLDTKLLEARERNDANAALKLLPNFEKLAEQTRSKAFLSAPIDNAELRARVARSYGSLLIFQAHKYDEAEALLSQGFLLHDAFAPYLRLCAFDQAHRPAPGSLLPDYLKRSLSEYQRRQEPRGQLLRGMILAQCYHWAGDQNALLRLKDELMKVVDTLGGMFGTETTVFSPITQRNERLDEIRQQIQGI